MASRSDRMYSDSPKVERGEDGKHEVKRKGKPASKPRHDMGEMGGRHARELSEMHRRHIDEHKALSERHEKEAAAAEAAMPQADGSDQNAAAPQQAAAPAAA